MRFCPGVNAVFNDPNLVSRAGLAPVLELAERAGLHDLVQEHVHLDRPGGQNALLKVLSLVAGMVAGADSIDDMALLRHGAMRRLFRGVRAPSTLGTFLRAFTIGHVRQLDAVASRLLINLTRRAPLLSGAGELAYLDVDDTVKPTFGYAKQGAGRGYTGVKGLNALLAILSTASSRPVIAAARLRKGSTISANGAHRFIAEALITAKAAGATGTLVLRADLAFFQSDVIAAVLRRKACFSITARLNSTLRKAIDTIAADAWTTIKYTDAIWDQNAQAWISDAEVAEIGLTAFGSLAKAKQVKARLIVRRVPDVNPANQNPLFTVYRYHAVFTNSPLPMLQAEHAHRGHAIVEQVIADLKNGPLAHLPSGSFWASSGKQRLVRPRSDRVQPGPHRRDARLGLPRQGHHRHHPSPADQRSRTARPLRATPRPAPAGQLALAETLDLDGHGCPRRTTPRSLTHPSVPRGPAGATRGDHRTTRPESHVMISRPRLRMTQ